MNPKWLVVELIKGEERIIEVCFDEFEARKFAENLRGQGFNVKVAKEVDYYAE